MGRDIGEGGKLFAKNVAWTSFATFGSGLLTFVFTSLAARRIGVAEYGFVNLIFGVSFILLTLFQFGIPSAAEKYLSAAKEEKERRKIMSTALLGLLGFSTLAAMVFYGMRGIWSPIFGVPPALFVLAVGYTWVVAIQLLFAGYLRALGLFREQALIHVVSAFVYIAGILLFVFGDKDPGYKAFLAPVTLRWIVIIAATLVFLAIKFGTKWLGYFNGKEWKTLFRYGVYSIFAASASGLFGAFDKLILNHYWGPVSVGIYGAYGAASGILIGKLAGVLQMVFFPTMSGRSDHHEFFLILKKRALIGFFIFFLFGLASTVFGLYLYGSEYTFSSVYVIIFSMNAAMGAIAGFFFSLIASRDHHGARFVAIHYTVAVGIDIALNFLLIPRFGVLGAIGTTFVEHLYFYWVAGYYFRTKRT